MATSSDAMDIANIQESAATATSYITTVGFPASKYYLIARAEANGAPEGVLQAFNLIPNRLYENTLDVMKAIDVAVDIPAYKKNITGGLGLPGAA